MKRYRRIPAFEQFEVKLPLAADVCEHDSEESAPVVESSHASGEDVEGASFGGPGAHRFAASVNEGQALSSEEEVEEEDEENEQENDEEDETDEEEEDEEEENEESDDDETDDDENESEDDELDDDDEDDADESQEDESDEDDEEDTDEEDDEDEDEIVQTANLTGTGSGTAEFESETEDGGTERELTIEVTGTTPGTHEVKVNSTVVGSIVVGSDGTGRLELSSDPDDDETQLPDSVTITGGTTVMVGSVLMGTFPTTMVTATAAPLSQASASAVDESLPAVSGFTLGATANANSPVAKAAMSRALAVDTAVADLLLASTDRPADDELENTEFVGRSDERDLTTDAELAVYEAAVDAVGKSLEGA